MSGQTALLIGATGAVGKHVLRELIESNKYSRVGEYGRRVTPLDHLPSNAKDKLEQKTVDFEHIDTAGLRDGKWDVVIITYVRDFTSRRLSLMLSKIGNNARGCWKCSGIRED